MHIMMPKLHVGSGRTNGALSLFPVWGEEAFEHDYSTALAGAHVNEKTSPQISTLVVTNPGPLPLLLAEGQVLSGGRQDRMAARSVLVGPRSELPVDVVCVEEHRWDGNGYHVDSGRRASPRVRAGLYTNGDLQGEVWKRVSAYDNHFGANATASFTEHAKRAADAATALAQGLPMRPFPGQIGMVIAISGQPVSAELFDSPQTLAEHYKSIIQAAAMDAIGRPAQITPSRRARRFVDKASAVQLRRKGWAGVGVSFQGANQDAQIRALRYMGRGVHWSLSNPRYELAHAT
jgi:hypothetical protein